MNGGVTAHDLLEQALVVSEFSDLLAHPWVGICLGFSDVSSEISDPDRFGGHIRISGKTHPDTLNLHKQKTDSHQGCLRLLSILVSSVI
jgi:hypothetical protein